MPTAQLSDRTVILVDGPDAEHFLQNIITTDLDALVPAEAKPGALLTPQGKIMFDFIVSRRGETGLLLDCRTDISDDLVRRLTLYKLRAKLEISKQDQPVILVRWRDDSVSSSIDSTASQTDSTWLRDTRFPPEARVERGYSVDVETDASAEDFATLRVAYGIAESGQDFALGDAFPHDVLLDQIGGVGLRKGCYVGQEVVSRMQHRGTARRRIMLAEAKDDLPPSGAEIRAGGRVIGALGGSRGGRGLAVVRIDRVKDALDAGQEITAGDVPVSLSIPAWATYTLPQEKSGSEEG